MIKMNNVTIGYNSNIIKDNVTYSFKKGINYTIWGPSGVGKSTLLKTIAGIISPIEGNIEYNIPKIEVSYLPQHYTCFDWANCIENIAITERIKNRKLSKEAINKAHEYLDKVGLNGYAKSFPTQLSGGQKQRLALARTLFSSPKVILMDEPLSALDEDTRKSMQDLILNIHKETHNTIIMVTHSVTEANRMCDEIIHL